MLYELHWTIKWSTIMAFGLFISHHYASCTSPLRSSLRFSASRAWQSALIKQFVTEAGAEVFLYRGFEIFAFFESASAYLRYWDGDFHCGEAVAPIERAITYTGHTGRDCHGQTPADIHFLPLESVMPTKGNKDIPRSSWSQKLMPYRQISKKRETSSQSPWPEVSPSKRHKRQQTHEQVRKR